MINKVESIKLNKKELPKQISSDVILVNKLPHNIYTSGKGILISNPYDLTDKLLSVSAGVSKGQYSVLYVALLIEVIEKIKSMNPTDKLKTMNIVTKKAYAINQMIPRIEKRKTRLFVPEITLEEIQKLAPDIYKANVIPALVDYAIDLKEKSGDVYLFEYNQEGNNYEN
ncbi:hypothetical protein ABQ473_27420 [Klebsiella oxytoca]|uniref:hypothetical protein n=1 Tax=Klebsiella oxytoca TaxID=571 RepID=UPI003AADE066